MLRLAWVIFLGLLMSCGKASSQGVAECEEVFGKVRSETMGPIPLADLMGDTRLKHVFVGNQKSIDLLESKIRDPNRVVAPASVFTFEHGLHYLIAEDKGFPAESTDPVTKRRVASPTVLMRACDLQAISGTRYLGFTLFNENGEKAAVFQMPTLQ